MHSSSLTVGLLTVAASLLSMTSAAPVGLVGSRSTASSSVLEVLEARQATETCRRKSERPWTVENFEYVAPPASCASSTPSTVSFVLSHQATKYKMNCAASGVFTGSETYDCTIANPDEGSASFWAKFKFDAATNKLSISHQWVCRDVPGNLPRFTASGDAVLQPQCSTGEPSGQCPAASQVCTVASSTVAISKIDVVG